MYPNTYLSYETVSFSYLGTKEKMADKSSETSTAPSDEASKTRPKNPLPASSETTVKDEQAKKASSGLMDPQVSRARGTWHT